MSPSISTTVNTPPTSSNETKVSESLYRKHVLRARSTRNHFTFCRDWVWIMPKLEALFLQDLINRASSKKIARQTLKDKDGVEREYVVLSRKYLNKPPMCWDNKTQASYLSDLQKRGFIRIRTKGWKNKRRCRWIYIDILQIETAIDEATKTFPQRNALNVPFTERLNDPSTERLEAQNVPSMGRKQRSNNNSNVQNKESSLSPGFARATSTLEGFNPQVSDQIGLAQDRKRAELLWNKLLEKRLLDRRSKYRDWVKEFVRLREDDQVPDAEIEETLQDYLPRISLTMSTKEEGCLPQAFSAKTFRVKYLAIRARLACLEKSKPDEEYERLHQAAQEARNETGFWVDKKGNIRDEMNKLVPRDREDNISNIYLTTRALADYIRKQNGEET